MIAARSETTRHSNAAAPGAASWLMLAASPTFAVMALLTYVSGGDADMMCSAAHSVSPPSGMVPMYVLMSVFHLLPWLKLITRHRSIARASSEEGLYGSR
jgi:hypothetical protein